jgi:hypothetical protein
MFANLEIRGYIAGRRDRLVKLAWLFKGATAEQTPMATQKHMVKVRRAMWMSGLPFRSFLS